MRKRLILAAQAALLPLALATGWVAHGEAKPAADAPWPEAYFEIFKLAPGKQEAFIRRIAKADAVSRAGGQPPIQIYVHEDGADWDVLLYKPKRDSKPTPEQQAAMEAKSRELHMEHGPAYFVGIRSTIAAHTDTLAYGPITADMWLARLDKWRAENPGIQKPSGENE